jgi:hypothetical protein
MAVGDNIPDSAIGMVRWNFATNQFEHFNGGSSQTTWGTIVLDPGPYYIEYMVVGGGGGGGSRGGGGGGGVIPWTSLQVKSKTIYTVTVGGGGAGGQNNGGNSLFGKK